MHDQAAVLNKIEHLIDHVCHYGFVFVFFKYIHCKCVRSFLRLAFLLPCGIAILSNSVEAELGGFPVNFDFSHVSVPVSPSCCEMRSELRLLSAVLEERGVRGVARALVV